MTVAGISGREHGSGSKRSFPRRISARCRSTEVEIAGEVHTETDLEQDVLFLVEVSADISKLKSELVELENERDERSTRSSTPRGQDKIVRELRKVV